jgi:hypothetical protein
VDGQTTTNGNATSGVPVFNQLLGSASGLNSGAHTVVLTNTGSGSAVDLDSFIFQGQAGLGCVQPGLICDLMTDGILTVDRFQTLQLMTLTPASHTRPPTLIGKSLPGQT